jgi:aspartate/methionine/tyrosine aminotransferase
VLNTPHNPTGKCFTKTELEEISTILKEFPDCKVLSDEVYDFLTFDGVEHIPFASIGDNWLKTITVYSGGKLLNATGWKVGWAIAPPDLLRLGGIMNNTTFYCQNTPA